MVCGESNPGKAEGENVTSAGPGLVSVYAATASSWVRRLASVTSVTTKVRGYAVQTRKFETSAGVPATNTVRAACICGSDPLAVTWRRFTQAPGCRYISPHRTRPAPVHVNVRA